MFAIQQILCNHCRVPLVVKAILVPVVSDPNRVVSDPNRVVSDPNRVVSDPPWIVEALDAGLGGSIDRQ